MQYDYLTIALECMLKAYRFSLRKVLMIEATVDLLRFGWIIVAVSVIVMPRFTT